MPFQTIPVEITGRTNQNQSQQASNELAKNWYPQATPRGRSDSAMLPWYGATLKTTTTGGSDRGTHVFNNVLYHVIGNTLHSVDSSGTYTTIGTIDGGDKCIFDDNGSEMVITANGKAYAYDGSTLSVGDSTFNNTDTVTMLNNQFIYNDAGDQWFVSNAGDALTINGLNFASAESRGDDLVRPYAFKQWVYFFGEKTIEPWWNTGQGNPPFQRIDNGIIEKGLGGKYTVARTDQFLYFLGDDNNIYQVVQTQVRNISPPAIAYQMSKLDTANADAYTITKDGQDFYIISFGANELTYAYSEQLDEWFNLSTGLIDERYLGTSYQHVYDKDWVIDYRNANLVELSDTVYTELGDEIQRRRITPMINSSKLGLGAGERLLMSKAKIILQSGTGLVTGQGEDPQIMVEYSLDGGATWSPERWIETGRLGQYLIKAEYYEMISFYDIQFRITISDPVFSSLHDMSMDVKKAGY